MKVVDLAAPADDAWHRIWGGWMAASTRGCLDRSWPHGVLAQGLHQGRYRPADVHDLRGTAVTRLAIAGATESEIAV
jgi:hypothetical protein